MSLYICAPIKYSCISTLLRDVKNRLMLLYKLSECNGDTTLVSQLLRNMCFASESDGYIEHTARDLNAHYMLKLILPSHYLQFLCNAEQLLFSHRLKCNDDLSYPLQLMQVDIQTAFDTQIVTEEFEGVLNDTSAVATNVASINCIKEKKRCNNCTLGVPWRSVPRLVSSRSVILNGGIAEISCRQVLRVLRETFERHYIENCRMLSDSNQSERLRNLYPELYFELRRCMSDFLKKHPIGNNSNKSEFPILTSDNVNERYTNFPLCMQQLHASLIHTKRLPHHQRFRYSVFLKDIGMPLSQSLLFWEKLYSAAPSCGSSCSHSWEESGSRYRYSLRHMYGLEGRCREAKSHSCRYLQSLHAQPNECGGCPFVLTNTLDCSQSQDLGNCSHSQEIDQSLTSKLSHEPLLQLLRKQGISEELALKIISVAGKGNPSRACRMSLAYLRKKKRDKMGKEGGEQVEDFNNKPSSGLVKQNAKLEVTSPNELQITSDVAVIKRRRSLQHVNTENTKIRKMFSRTKSVIEPHTKSDWVTFGNIKKREKKKSFDNTVTCEENNSSLTQNSLNRNCSKVKMEHVITNPNSIGVRIDSKGNEKTIPISSIRKIDTESEMTNLDDSNLDFFSPVQYYAKLSCM